MVNLKVLKSADVNYVFLGCMKKIKYTVTIENIGSTDAYCVRVKDFLSEGIKILRNSIRINGCYNNCLENKVIDVGKIKAGEIITITYVAEIPANYENNTIINKVLVSYCDGRCSYDIERESVESNILTIPVFDLSIKVRKNVDKLCAMSGDNLYYTIKIKNEGTVNIDNAVLKDYLPENIILDKESITINGIPAYLDNLDNVLLGTIVAGAMIIVTFKVRVESNCCKDLVKNKGVLDYQYTVLIDELEFTSIGTSYSNCAITKISCYG